MFIKITSSEIAKDLEKMGFKCMRECINGNCIYVFERTEELAKWIMTNYGGIKPVRDDKLNF